MTNTRSMTGVCAGLAMMLASCSQMRYTPLEDHSQLGPLEFSHLLAEQPAVTFEQGCRAVLLLADGEERFQTHETRVGELVSRGVVRAEWNLQSDHPLDRGTLAHMIYKVCQIRGGLNVRWADWSGIGDRRYALVEVVRAQIMPYGLPYQVPTGGEVAMALSKADDYMAKHGMYATNERDIDSPADVGVGG